MARHRALDQRPGRADFRHAVRGDAQRDRVFGHQIGSFIGVWLAGYLYDTTGSYNGVFLASIGLGVFAAIVNLPVNETPLAQRKAVPAAA